jgi:hypothetical protein
VSRANCQATPANRRLISRRVANVATGSGAINAMRMAAAGMAWSQRERGGEDSGHARRRRNSSRIAIMATRKNKAGGDSMTLAWVPASWAIVVRIASPNAVHKA